MDAKTKKQAILGAFGIILLLAVIITAGCSRQQTTDQPKAPVSDAQTYVVRGEVISVPQAEKAGMQFIVKHEPIHNFRNTDGQIVGMNTMGMPFTPGTGVSLEGIKPGDKIEMLWVLQWKPVAKEYVQSVRKLPPETQLMFGEAHPPTTSPETAPSKDKIPGM
jgi:Cu/Ag efflux protein CusF